MAFVARLVAFVISFFPFVAAAEPVASGATSSMASTSVAPTSAIATGQSPFSAESAVELMIGLGLVVSLIFVLAWFARRMGGISGFSHPELKVVASIAMSARERLVLVQAGEQQLLLGVAPGRVNLIQSFDQPIITPQETPASQFAERLKEALGRSKKG